MSNVRGRVARLERQDSERHRGEAVIIPKGGSHDVITGGANIEVVVVPEGANQGWIDAQQEEAKARAGPDGFVVMTTREEQEERIVALFARAEANPSDVDLGRRTASMIQMAIIVRGQAEGVNTFYIEAEAIAKWRAHLEQIRQGGGRSAEGINAVYNEIWKVAFEQIKQEAAGIEYEALKAAEPVEQLDRAAAADRQDDRPTPDPAAGDGDAATADPGDIPSPEPPEPPPPPEPSIPAWRRPQPLGGGLRPAGSARRPWPK